MKLCFLKVVFFSLSMFVLAACGGGDKYDLQDNGQGSGGSSPSPSPEPAPEPTPQPAPEPTPEPAPTPAPAPTPVTYSVTVSWVAPTTYSDGSPMSLSRIGGYRIYYGVASRQYTQSVNVPDGTAQSAVISNLPSGTYYFSIVAYDTDAVSSDYAQEFRITL